MRVSLHNLGCRLNQLEGEAILNALSDQGAAILSARHPIQDQASGLYIVNTCAVTAKAEQKARHAIRRALAESDRYLVLVTGCSAELAARDLEGIDCRVVVLKGGKKSRLIDLAKDIVGLFEAYPESEPVPALAQRLRLLLATEGKVDDFAFAPGDFSFHSRAMLKVQDGCDNQCAYCVVRIARGPSRSLALELAAARAQELERRGWAECVLTGLNLSQYQGGLAGLLRHLCQATSRIRFRISSFEPDRLDRDFLEAVSHPRVLPFFHIPLQSACPATLARMGRSLDLDAFCQAVAELRRIKDDPFISFDVIAGFPGEDEAEFGQSLSIIRGLRPAWIHAFPFSPRPGTAAFSMKPIVCERIRGERLGILEALAMANRRDYAASWMGRTVGAVVERGSLSPGEPSLGQGLRGFSFNALRLGLSLAEGSSPPPAGSLVECLLAPSPDTSLDAQGIVRY